MKPAWKVGPRPSTVAHPEKWKGRVPRISLFASQLQFKKSKLGVEVASKPVLTQGPKNVCPLLRGPPRFRYLGLHPVLVKAVPKTPGPGAYNPMLLTLHMPNFDWTRKQELEDWSQNMGYRHDIPVWHQKRLMIEGLGPGTHEIPDFTQLISSKSFAEFSKQKRFVGIKSNTPGPGTYKFDMVETYRGTPVCPFEWDGFKERVLTPERAWCMPPGYMRVPDKEDISERVKRSTSRRGPYDIFTGPREDKNMKNHFAPPAFRANPDWEYLPPSGVEILNSNPYSGKWAVEERFSKVVTTRLMLQSYCDPALPGPGQYDIEVSKVKTQPDEGKSRHRKKPTIAFLSSVSVPARQPLTTSVTPGVGRYRFRMKKRAITYWSAFRSKTDRKPFNIPKSMDINS